MANQNTNIKLVLDRILQHPLLQDVSLEQAVSYTIDFMRIVGVPTIFTNKVVTLEVDKYKALLPCDFYEVIQLRSCKGYYRYTTDSFHLSDCKTQCDLTYKIQGNIIFTSTESDDIELSYLAIEVDEDGFPLIPDNSSFIRALELYIKKQWFTILFDMGKINQAVLYNTQKEYSWAVGDCQTEFNRLSIDKAESLFNSLNSLIKRTNEFNRGFTTNGNRGI